MIFFLLLYEDAFDFSLWFCSVHSKASRSCPLKIDNRRINLVVK